MIFGRTAYHVQRLPVVIPIGVQTETGVEEIAFDVSAWAKKWPDMEVTVWHRLPSQADAYLCRSRREGDIVYWEVTDTDTQPPGTGRVELMGTTAAGRKLSGSTATRIKDTIAATTQDPPLAPPKWVETVQEMLRQSGGSGGGGGTAFRTDETLSYNSGVLSVNTAKTMEKDNTLPITSAAVYTEVGNINALLETI